MKKCIDDCRVCGTSTMWRDEKGAICYDCNPPSLDAIAGQDLIETHPHTFNRHAIETINKAKEICALRAGEYMDSWALENLRTPFTDSVSRLDFDSGPLNKEAMYAWAVLKRLRIMAAMCDIKLSRMSGPFKEDTYVDLINYIGAFCGLRKEWEALPENKAKGTP